MSIENDITQMFHVRLRQLLDDSGDTAHRAGIDDDDISKILITGLLAEVVIGSLTLQMDETNFLRICRSAYQQMVKMLAKQEQREQEN